MPNLCNPARGKSTVQWLSTELLPAAGRQESGGFQASRPRALYPYRLERMWEESSSSRDQMWAVIGSGWLAKQTQVPPLLLCLFQKGIRNTIVTSQQLYKTSNAFLGHAQSLQGCDHRVIGRVPVNIILRKRSGCRTFQFDVINSLIVLYSHVHQLVPRVSE